MSTDIDEQLIGQLVLTDDSVATSIGAIIKSVTAADRLCEFKKAVKRYSDQRNLEINDICNTKYSSFFKCLDWQQSFRSDLAVMTEKVDALKEALGNSGEVLLAKKLTRLELLETQANLERCINACSDSLKAFNLAQMAALHILDRKFEDALRQLEILSKQIRCIEEFSFAQQLKQWIPSQLARIHDFANNELKSWMSSVRDNAENIGKLEDTIVRMLHEEHMAGSKQSIADGATITLSFEVFLLERLGDKDLFEDQDLKNSQLGFYKLLKAAHLFELMDRSDLFRETFVDNLKLQSDFMTSFPSNGTNMLSRIVSYSHRMYGFLLIERHVRTLVPEIDVSDLSTSISLFIQTMHKNVPNFLDGSDCKMVDVLHLLGNLSRLLHSAKLRFGLESSPFEPLLSLCMDVFYRYQDLLLLDYQERSFALCQEGHVDLFVELLLKFIDDYFHSLSTIPADISDMFDISKKLLVDKFIDCCLLQVIVESEDFKRVSQLESLAAAIPRLESAFAFQACMFALNNNHKLPIMKKIDHCRHKLEKSLLHSSKTEVDDIFKRHSKLEYKPNASQSVAGFLVKDIIEFIVNANDSYWSEVDEESALLLKMSICRYVNIKLTEMLTVEKFNATFATCFKVEVYVLTQYVNKVNRKFGECFAEISQVSYMCQFNELLGRL